MTRKTFYVIALWATIGFTDIVVNNPNNMVNSCHAATYQQDSDGYIYKGTITLTRIVSGKRETFYHFNKRGVDYVAKYKKGPYYRLERRMTINHIDYKY